MIVLTEDKQVTTLTGVAVAVVSLARFIATESPDLASYLSQALSGAESAGLAPDDLELLRTIIQSISLT